MVALELGVSLEVEEAKVPVVNPVLKVRPARTWKVNPVPTVTQELMEGLGSPEETAMMVLVDLQDQM